MDMGFMYFVNNHYIKLILIAIVIQSLFIYLNFMIWLVPVVVLVSLQIRFIRYILTIDKIVITFGVRNTILTMFGPPPGTM